MTERWHAIAMRTVLPSLKSAREYCSQPQSPQILCSGTLQECHAFLVELKGGRMINDAVLASRGLPVFATGDWTYYVVKERVS